MSTRQARLPLDHLEAELTAYPLASEAALGSALEALCPRLQSETARAFWRATERDLMVAWPSVGLDELVAMRDRIWFEGEGWGGRRDPVPLDIYLERIASRLLEQRGSLAVPRRREHVVGEAPRSDEEASSRRAWRWMSFALPEDLLCAALHPEQPAQKTDPLDPLLARNLADRGFAETHLHVFAALSFPHFWIATLHAVTTTDLKPDAFASPGAVADHGQELGPWLLRVVLVRYLLSVFLHLRSRGEGGDFRDFLRTRLRREACAGWSATQIRTLDRLIRETLAGQCRTDPRRFETEKRVVRRMIRWRAKPPQHPDDLWSFDPISKWVPCSGSRGGSSETGFVASGLRYLRASGPDRDPYFSGLFWQAVRVRCLYYRHVTQRPLTPGLQWFIRTYGRMKAGRRTLSTELFIESAAKLSGRGRGAKALELRTSPDENLSDQLAFLKALGRTLEGWRTAGGGGGSMARGSGSEPMEIGLVLHFSKLRGGGWEQGRPSAFGLGSHGDPSFDLRPRRRSSTNPTGYRYARFYRQARQRARTLVRCLTSFPISLKWIRGLDVCTDERGVPTWVLAPLTRYVHEAGEVASRYLHRHFALDIPPLRTTLHCGEDYIHLLTGLRSIDESIRYFRLRQGDRLGHALALGVDPEKWCHRSRYLYMTREERLWDLAWEWRWYARRSDLSSPRRDVLGREIAELTEAIFGREIPPLRLEQWTDGLHEESLLKRLRFPEGPLPYRVSAEHRTLRGEIRHYLADRHCFRSGQEIIRVDTAGEVETLAILQAGLRRKVGALGLTVEVNPSSNLLIGDLGEVGEHPLWRLHSPEGEADPPPLDVSIGSDDPLTFATNLLSEYQWVKDAMGLSGYSQAQAQAWLEKARRAGLDSRFTLPPLQDPTGPWAPHSVHETVRSPP